MATDAQRKANSKYLATKKTLTIRINPKEYEKLKKVCDDLGVSVQRYILNAVRDKMMGVTMDDEVFEQEKVPELYTEEGLRIELNYHEICLLLREKVTEDPNLDAVSKADIIDKLAWIHDELIDKSW